MCQVIPNDEVFNQINSASAFSNFDTNAKKNDNSQEAAFGQKFPLCINQHYFNLVS